MGKIILSSQVLNINSRILSKDLVSPQTYNKKHRSYAAELIRDKYNNT